MKTRKEVDSPKLLLSALMVRAVKDWKRIRAKGVDPNSTTWSQRRAIDHTLDEADLAHLVAFFNCPLVDKALEAIRFPFNLADIRRELEIPNLSGAPPSGLERCGLAVRSASRADEPGAGDPAV